MEEFVCNLPTRVIFGLGKLRLLGEILKNLGSKVFLVADPYLSEAGLCDEIISLLKKESKEITNFTQIHPNPSCSDVDQGADIAKENKCDVILAVGGGSTLDTAKGVAILAINPGKSWEYVERTDHKVLRPKEVLPIIAIPTTAGTGSEVTPYALLNNPTVKEKRPIYSRLIFPRIAIVDPNLMVSMPPRLTAFTGIDALSHSVESYISIGSNSYAKLLARESIKIIARYLPEAVANGNNIETRSKMAWASTLGGMAIAHVGTALPHALGQSISGLLDAPHGGTLASCLARVLQFSFTSNFQRFAEIAEAIDESIRIMPLRERAEKSGELVQRLIKDVNGEARFSDFGMQEKDIDKVTQLALSTYSWDIRNHPKQVTADDIKKLYKECL